MPAEQAVGEHLRHTGVLANTLQPTGGAYDEKNIRDTHNDARGPRGVAKKAQALQRLADDHDAKPGEKQNKREAEADDELARRSAAEWRAWKVAERLHHEKDQRNRASDN